MTTSATRRYESRACTHPHRIDYPGTPLGGVRRSLLGWAVFRVAVARYSALLKLDEPVTLGRTPSQADLLRSTVHFCEDRHGAGFDL
jgi:hypothetical protein